MFFLSALMSLFGLLAHAQTVEWELTPYSADYQSDIFSKITARPEQVVDSVTRAPLYPNLYPGIKKTRHYFEDQFYPDLKKKGISLALRFIYAVESENQDPELVQWLYEKWYPSMQPQRTESWVGYCDNLAVWGMDPKIHQALDRINDGMMCSGVPFTKGETKELFTRLYSIPYLDPKHRQDASIVVNDRTVPSFFQRKNASARDREDANIALSKMGLMGKGGVDPGNLVSLASQTKNQGMMMFMDRDPGEEIWNQPIKKVSDTVVVGREPDPWQWVTVQQLQSLNDPGNEIWNALQKIELEFSHSLFFGYGVERQSLCDLSLKILRAECPELGTLVAQVEFFNGLKKLAVAQGVLKFKDGLSPDGPQIITHELAIEYGVENGFASMEPDHTQVVKYQYREVRDRRVDGTFGDARTYWDPPSSSLKEICDGSVSINRIASSLTPELNFKEECSRVSDQEKWHYFTGSVPPEAFRELVPAPSFAGTVNAQLRKRAYEKLLAFVSGECPTFDRAADFLRQLDQALGQNGLDKTQGAALAQKFQEERSFLDENWLRNKLKDHEAFRSLFFP